MFIAIDNGPNPIICSVSESMKLHVLLMNWMIRHGMFVCGNEKPVVLYILGNKSAKMLAQ